ncbi:MAG: hypothetical protein M3Z35_02550 [Nitrospirota bacterium]|nr:hypothetical protein [Nitrospirota bacterium]
MTNLLSADGQPEATGNSAGIPNSRLWFEVAGSGVAWFGLGLADMVITWRACVHEEQFGGPSSHPGALVLYFVMWIVLFGLATFAGTMSYRSWRTLSGVRELLSAEGRERKEFMSLAGLFISLTLGIGMVWLCLPLFILQMCARAR